MSSSKKISPMPNRLLIPILFFIALFIIRYYDFFYLYLPVRVYSMGGSYEPTLTSFLVYNYLLKIFLIGLKFLTVASVLAAGIFLEGKVNKTEMVGFRDLLVLAILAEFVLLGSDLTKIIHFTFINPSYDLEQYESFFPLSLFNALSVDGASEFAYVLQTLNLFEAAYIAVLIWGLRRLQYPQGLKAVEVTLFSYGSLLVIWMLIMTYFML